MPNDFACSRAALQNGVAVRTYERWCWGSCARSRNRAIIHRASRRFMQLHAAAFNDVGQVAWGGTQLHAVADASLADPRLQYPWIVRIADR
eukprot:15460407-Alexandrium_andersonii.AAC.1